MIPDRIEPGAHTGCHRVTAPSPRPGRPAPGGGGRAGGSGVRAGGRAGGSVVRQADRRTCGAAGSSHANESVAPGVPPGPAPALSYLTTTVINPLFQPSNPADAPFLISASLEG